MNGKILPPTTFTRSLCKSLINIKNTRFISLMLKLVPNFDTTVFRSCCIDAGNGFINHHFIVGALKVGRKDLLDFIRKDRKINNINFIDCDAYARFLIETYH